MKNVAVVTEDTPPRGIWQLNSPHPWKFAIQGKKMLMRVGQPGGEGGWGFRAQLELTDVW